VCSSPVSHSYLFNYPSYWSQTHRPDSLLAGASLQCLPESGDLLTERTDIQGAQLNELITLIAQPAVITVINLTSNIHRRRYRLRVAQEKLILIPTIRLLEMHGPVLLPEARNVVPINHMHDGSSLIHPVRHGGARWTVGVAIGSWRLARHSSNDHSQNIPEELPRLSRVEIPGLPS
jgi:hypothetical protein